MKKRFVMVAGMLMCLLMLFGKMEVAQASSFVKDDAHVLSEETIQYINQLNTEKYSQLYGAPEYAVVTIPSLDDSIEETTQNLFDQYGFGKKEYDNGLVFVLAVEDREFRLGTGDGFYTVFQHLDESQLVDETAKDYLRAENYDAAVRQISDVVYDDVVQADSREGLAAVYEQGPLAIQEEAAEKQAATDRMIKGAGIAVGIVAGLSLTGTAGYLTYKQQRIKNSFESANVIPRKLLNDPLFNKAEFLKWCRKNDRRFYKFKNQSDCLAALKAYLVEEFFSQKSAATNFSSEDRRFLEAVLVNQQIQLYFADYYLHDVDFSLEVFLQQVKTAATEVGDYPSHLQTHLENYMATLDLTNSIVEENQHLIPEYKTAILEAAKNKISEKQANQDYLAEVLIERQNQSELRATIAAEVANIVAEIQNEALFQVDLEKVYHRHPDLRKRMAKLSDDDYQQVMGEAQNQYSPGIMNYAMFYFMFNNQLTHQEEVVASSNDSSSNSFGGFGGGGSSGGGVSGGW